ncbi:MAG: hypothetical protein WB822_12855, partial [Rhodoplanes sp.]
MLFNDLSLVERRAMTASFVRFWHLARGRGEFGCLALLNACSEAGSLRDRSVCSGLDCFLFPSRNSSRRDANLR